MPHGFCYRWDPAVLWLHVLSDLTIFLAYFSIPIALLVFIRKRTDLENFRMPFYLFIAFILLCGTTHLIEAYTIWVPAYRLSGLMKAMTAFVSVVTATALWPIIPKALQIPSLQELKASNTQLRQEILEREKAERELQDYQNQLEEKVKERTHELETAKNRLEQEVLNHQQAQEQISFQASLLDQVRNAVIATDNHHRIIYWNKHAQNLYEWQAEEVIQKLGIHQVIPLPHLNLETTSNPAFRWEGEIDSLSKSGRRLPVYCTHSLVKDAQNQVIGQVNISFDISEKKKTERELQAAKEKAEQSAKAKEEFLSTMSHEIRTPMNGIIGMTHILLQNNPRPHQVENLNTLKFASESLLSLINNILDFSKIEAQKLKLEATPFNLRELLRGTKQLHKPKAWEKQVALDFVIQPEVPSLLLGDPLRIGQILNNLISNAIKFTKEGQVSVLVQADSKVPAEGKTRLHFSVKDTGIGIPQDKLEAIFESFQQASSDTTRRFGGSGLGLSITKSLLELHQSSIQVESTVGEGSCFSFVLALEEAQRLSPEDHHINQSASPELAMEQLNGLSILLVEDNPVNRLVVTKFLESYDVLLDYAENGKIAVEKFRNLATQGGYDLILMDIHTPEMDGYNSTQLIRSLENQMFFSPTPIIAFTASVLQEDKFKIFEVGMDDFLIKPFNPNDLYAIILKHIKKSDLPPQKASIKKVKGKLVSLTGGNMEYQSELLTLYIRQLKECREQFGDILLARDRRSLKDLRHKMRVMMVSLGLDELAESFNQGINLLMNQETNIKTLQSSVKHTEEIIDELLEQFESGNLVVQS